MASSQNYSPSAPPLPESYKQESLSDSHRYHGHQSYAYSQPYSQPSSYEYSSVPQAGSYFPPGTNPDIIRNFQMVDGDRSGFIDDLELQRALSSGYEMFSLRTIRFLTFLFKNPVGPSKIGPNEFAALWNCLGQWRAIFQSFDRDRSGKIDSMELKDAFYSLGFAVPPSVLQLLISKYDDGSGRRVELSFDSFVECGMIIKGLTEKFKEKDVRYAGSATFSYDSFMSMVIPFIVP